MVKEYIKKKNYLALDSIYTYYYLVNTLKKEFNINTDELYFENNLISVKNNRLFISLSHSKNAIAYAISKNCVGLDIIEKHSNIDFDNLALTILNNEDYINYQSSLDKSSYFLRVFAKLEATAKYKKVGLGLRNNTFNINNTIVIDTPAHFIALAPSDEYTLIEL